jgi:hypothetical protein
LFCLFFLFQVGHDTLGLNQLVENVSKIVFWLKRKYPGGWRNVQKLSLHSGGDGKMPPLVIYFSLGTKIRKNNTCEIM